MTIDITSQSTYIKALLQNVADNGAYIGGLSWTGNAATGTTVTYSIDASLSGQTTAIETALAYWSTVANITFEPDEDAQITFTDGELEIENKKGEATRTFNISTQQLSHVDITIDTDQHSGFGIGEDGFLTLLHEIGHAAGLSHPGGSGAAAGSNAQYNRDGTTMSYNPGYKADNTPYNATPMAYDIAAIQFLYGVNTATNSTTPHYLNGSYATVATLWDYDGGDSIEVSGSGSATIDLREGPGHYSEQGDNVFFIAYGANINKAVGSASADTITGNNNANSISGGAGNDTIAGSTGDDTMTGGADDDTFIFEFANGDEDTITDFTLTEDQLDLSKLGVFGYDLEANATESGGDTTLHINGMDIVVQGVTKTDLFNPSNAAFTGLLSGTAGNVIDGTGSNEYIYGSWADAQGDTITANNDTIIGNGGNDYLQGNGGSDTYIFHKGDGYDSIHETEADTNILRLIGITSDEVYLNLNTSYGTLNVTVNDGSAQGGVSINNMSTYTSGYEIRYVQLDDLTYDVAEGMHFRALSGGGEVVRALDNAGDDTVDGAAGNDVLYGYGGNDVMDGGAGNDTLYGGDGDNDLQGGDGNDYIYGGADEDTLAGGAGSDYLQGNGGDDLYIILAGEGNTLIYDNAGSNTLDIDGAYSFYDSGNDRSFTITSTSETIWVYEYNLHSWSVI